MIGHGKFTSLRSARGHLPRHRPILPALYARIPVRAVLPYGKAGGGGDCSTVVGTGKDLIMHTLIMFGMAFLSMLAFLLMTVDFEER